MVSWGVGCFPSLLTSVHCSSLSYQFIGHGLKICTCTCTCLLSNADTCTCMYMYMYSSKAVRVLCKLNTKVLKSVPSQQKDCRTQSTTAQKLPHPPYCGGLSSCYTTTSCAPTSCTTPVCTPVCIPVCTPVCTPVCRYEMCRISPEQCRS